MTDIVTPFDAIPIDVRRRNWGWFGNPWPGFVCYDDGGRLLADMCKPTPVGEACLLCGEPIVAGDRGQAFPCFTADGPPAVRHAHAECALRNVTGSVEHLDGRCTCSDPDRPVRSYRDEALEVWARFAGGAR